ncbi:MAG: hypothetical protein QXR35_06730 [Candidatus Korarchaeum sp.]
MGFEETLLKVEIYAHLPRRELGYLVSRLISEMESIGFVTSLRAEGYAFLPAGLPVPTHIRAGVYEEAVSIWVRGASELVESSRMLGTSPEDYFESLMRGLRRAGELVRSFSGKGVVRVVVPET